MYVFSGAGLPYRDYVCSAAGDGVNGTVLVTEEINNMYNDVN